MCLNRQKLDNESSANFTFNIRNEIRKPSLMINTICIGGNLDNVQGTIFCVFTGLITTDCNNTKSQILLLW